MIIDFIQLTISNTVAGILPAGHTPATPQEREQNMESVSQLNMTLTKFVKENYLVLLVYNMKNCKISFHMRLFSDKGTDQKQVINLVFHPHSVAKVRMHAAYTVR